MGSNDGDNRTTSRSSSGLRDHQANPATMPGAGGGVTLRRGISGLKGRAWLRWVPAAAVPAVIATGVLAGTLPARAGDPLPEKTPAEVIALLASHGTRTFSGTIEQSSELGLPELPASPPTSGRAAADDVTAALELLTGEHTARVFVDGASKARIQVVDRLAERDVIRNNNDVWFYSSKANSAAHLTLPSSAGDLPLMDPGTAAPPHTPPPHTPTLHAATPHTPQELADRFLAAAGGSTAVTLGPAAQAAGRPAYSLLLEPRSDATLVGKVDIAVDAENGMPLAVKVFARGAAAPAFSVGFSTLSLEAPDEAMFSFAPPPGSSVEELQVPPPSGHLPGSGYPRDPAMYITPDALADGIQDNARRYLTGAGWETVVELPVESQAGSTLNALLSRSPVLSQAAAAVPGGRLVSTVLFNVLLTDDGRVFAGMVPPERLQAAATAP